MYLVGFDIFVSNTSVCMLHVFTDKMLVRLKRNFQYYTNSGLLSWEWNICPLFLCITCISPPNWIKVSVFFFFLVHNVLWKKQCEDKEKFFYLKSDKNIFFNFFFTSVTLFPIKFLPNLPNYKCVEQPLYGI